MTSPDSLRTIIDSLILVNEKLIAEIANIPICPPYEPGLADSVIYVTFGICSAMTMFLVMYQAITKEAK